MSRNTGGRRFLIGILVLVPAATLALMVGLRRDFTRPNLVWPTQMADTPAYMSQRAGPAPGAGLAMRAPAPGTLPRGIEAFHYGIGDEERDRAGRELTNPIEPTAGNLERGRWVYETFCQVCHGVAGAGDGTIIPRFPNPPDLRLAATMTQPDGALYHSVTLGRNKMSSFAAQLRPADRWKAVLHIRLLQGMIESPAPPTGSAAVGDGGGSR